MRILSSCGRVDRIGVARRASPFTGAQPNRIALNEKASRTRVRKAFLKSDSPPASRLPGSRRVTGIQPPPALTGAGIILPFSHANGNPALVARLTGFRKVKTFNDKIFVPPAPSEGSRTPPLRSAGSHRSTLVDPRRNRIIRTESHGELSHALRFLTNPHVDNVIEQQPVVPWVNARGKNRRHVFDMLITYRGGHRVACAVKPLATALKHAFRDELKLIASQMSSDVADSVMLLTEYSCQPWDLTNAKLRYSVLRDPPDVEAIEIVRGVAIARMTIAEIVAAVGLAGRAYRAIVRLIANAELIVLSEGIYDYATVVAPACLDLRGRAA